jgi:tetratricopeptide (TPR) repeat protein
MKNYWLKCAIWFLLIFNSKNAYCQTASQLLLLAKQETEIGNYQAAIDYYERISFFESEILSSADYHAWAIICSQTKDYDRAKQLYQRAIGSSTNLAEQQSLGFELGLMLISNGKFDEAIVALLGLNEEGMSVKLISDKHKYLAISYFGTNNFKDSKDEFILAAPNHSQEISNKFTKIEKLIKRYNPKKAKTLNIILPGLGYFYLGKFWRGVNSFALNAGLITLGIIYAGKIGFMDSFLTMSSPIQRYYVGGFTKAEIAAKEKITFEQNKIAQNLIELVFLEN